MVVGSRETGGCRKELLVDNTTTANLQTCREGPE